MGRLLQPARVAVAHILVLSGVFAQPGDARACSGQESGQDKPAAAIIPAMFILAFPQLAVLNVMQLSTPESAMLSAVIFNAVIIILLIPLALRGISYKPLGAAAILRRAVADEVGEKAASYRTREGLEPALVPERVMVAMSSYGAAPRVIRTGARIAGRLGARWYAVYVETPKERPDQIRHDDLEALNQNISLAKRLGATVVRVKAAKASDGLIAFARREGITHVIFGQSQRSRWELLWRDSVIDRFLREVPDAAVQVVPIASSRV